MLRSGGANYQGAEIALTTSYKTVADKWETNPATSQPWTPSEVNGIQGGIEVAS